VYVEVTYYCYVHEMQEARTGQRQYLGWGKQDMNTKSWWEVL